MISYCSCSIRIRLHTFDPSLNAQMERIIHNLNVPYRFDTQYSTSVFVRSVHNIESSLNDSCEGYFSFSWIKECGPLVPIHTIQQSRISWLRTNVFNCIAFTKGKWQKPKQRDNTKPSNINSNNKKKTVPGDNAEGSPKIEKWFFDWEAENSGKIYEFSWNSMDSLNDSMLFILVVLTMIRCVVCRLFYGHFHFIHSFTFWFNQILVGIVSKEMPPSLLIVSIYRYKWL